MAAGIDGTARLWDRSGHVVAAYRGASRFLGDADLSPDGQFVAAGGADGRLRFWEAATGQPLWTTPAHTSAIVGVHYDGDDLITRGEAGDIIRWHLPPK